MMLIFLVYLSEPEASAKICVYMCLFWWEYLYRYISEYFLLGMRSCGRFAAHESEEFFFKYSNVGPELLCCRIKTFSGIAGSV